MADQLAQRLAGDGADVLLELRDRRAVERPVSGIVHPQRISLTKTFGPPFPCTTNISTASTPTYSSALGPEARNPALNTGTATRPIPRRAVYAV
jgi:hypothetical protein